MQAQKSYWNLRLFYVRLRSSAKCAKKAGISASPSHLFALRILNGPLVLFLLSEDAERSRADDYFPHGRLQDAAQAQADFPDAHC